MLHLMDQVLSIYTFLLLHSHACIYMLKAYSTCMYNIYLLQCMHACVTDIIEMLPYKSIVAEGSIDVI